MDNLVVGQVHPAQPRTLAKGIGTEIGHLGRLMALMRRRMDPKKGLINLEEQPMNIFGKNPAPFATFNSVIIS